MTISEQAVKAAHTEYHKVLGDKNRSNPMLAALTAAAPHMSGVKVKQLEWREVKSLVGRKLIASDCFGREFARIDLLNHTHDDLDIKKAEYQANYENGILSALEPSSVRDQALEEALRNLLHAVCGETGFANAVRQVSGLPWPWPSLDIAEAKAIRALSAEPAQQPDGL